MLFKKKKLKDVMADSETIGLEVVEKRDQALGMDWGDVESYYDKSAVTIKDSAKAMGWSSAFNQQLRFDVINLMVDVTGLSVLDVGCGDGALFHYLKKQDIDCKYKGLDLSKEMVQRAQERYPGINVRQGNMFNSSTQHDVVVCSGGLSFCPSDDTYQFLFDAIDHLFCLAKGHVVFNLLTTVIETKQTFFAKFDPIKVIEYCFTLTPYVSMYHNYLPNDFTVHLIKK